MSSIWSASKETKLLWITMLAIKDKDGFVRAVPSALARTAGLTIEEAKQSLLELESPDPESSSKEHEGRRIKTVEGGWQILNHAKYQKSMSEIFTRARKATWERVKRENNRQAARREEKADAINAMKPQKKQPTEKLPKAPSLDEVY